MSRKRITVYSNKDAIGGSVSEGKIVMINEEHELSTIYQNISQKLGFKVTKIFLVEGAEVEGKYVITKIVCDSVFCVDLFSYFAFVVVCYCCFFLLFIFSSDASVIRDGDSLYASAGEAFYKTLSSKKQ